MSAQEGTDGQRRVELRHDPGELDRLNEFVRDVAAEEGLSPEQRFALDLCLEEAMTNIFRHSGPADKSAPSFVTVLSAAPQLTICIEDEGPPFDPTTAAQPSAATSLEDASIGGLGIMLMRKMTRSMSYERRGHRNRLILRFGPADAAPPGAQA